jgi:Fe2+ or Zn2+ uptake regulation protein
VPRQARVPHKEKNAASPFKELATARLREKGLRITAARMSVVHALDTADTPLTPQGIFERIQAQGDTLDVVSVYRVLAALAELGLVHHIGVVDGYVACTFGREHGKETQHVVCDSCGHVWELPLAEGVYEATKNLLKRKGIRAMTIKIEITATCQSCNKH